MQKYKQENKKLKTYSRLAAFPWMGVFFLPMIGTIVKNVYDSKFVVTVFFILLGLCPIISVIGIVLYIKEKKKNKAKKEEELPKAKPRTTPSGPQQLSEKEAMDLLCSLETVYVEYSKSTGTKYPSVDMNASAWVFSSAQYAEISKAKNAAFGLDYQPMSLPQFREFVKQWYTYGVLQIRINPGIGNYIAQVRTQSFMPLEGIQMFDYYGSNLNQYILRFKQMRACDDVQAQAFARTLWSVICHTLYQSVFLVPISFDDVPDDAVDTVLHLTPSAIAWLENLQKENEKEGTIQPHTIDGHLKNIIGAEGYSFLSERDDAPRRVMHLRTVTNGTSSLLCGFTDVRDLKHIFGENVHIALWRYEEIIEHLNDQVSDGCTIEGFIINAGSNELILNREQIEFAKAESMEPTKVFM